MDNSTDLVRSVFENPDRYLSRRAFDVRIRAETVRELVRLPDDARILDIGCGDGSISLPLITESNRITLLDVSTNMLSIATSKIPSGFSANVEIINKDFMEVMFSPESFDLILCIGLLVHVPSHADFIAKMVGLLKPTGSIIVECTDATHFVGDLLRPIYRVKSLFRRSRAPLNPVVHSEIVKILAHHGLSPQKTFRYSQPLPGLHRVFSQENLYRLNRWVFGTLQTNRNRWLGNEYITLFSRNQCVR
jgi:2-polyprenyl-3-methyl-5-hydroxy-6-metoxy-1,4-benzoquinol methylase